MIHIREGECNQCGECCKDIAEFMLDLSTRWCRYLEETTGVYICLITENKFSEMISKPEWVSEKDYEYWLIECKSYPNPNDSSHCPPIHELPEKCNYRIVEQ